LHRRDLRVGRGDQQRLSGHFAGQCEVGRFVAVFVQIRQRLLAFDFTLDTTEGIQIECHTRADGVDIGNAWLRPVVSALPTARCRKIDLRVQFAFCCGNRRGGLTQRCVSGDQFKVAVDGAAHHLVELRRAQRRPPIAVNALAHVETLSTGRLLGLLIVVR
jgi:hypothetical protein